MRCKASVSLAVEHPDDKILALVCGGSSNHSQVGCPLLLDALFLKVNLNGFFFACFSWFRQQIHPGCFFTLGVGGGLCVTLRRLKPLCKRVYCVLGCGPQRPDETHTACLLSECVCTRSQIIQHISHGSPPKSCACVCVDVITCSVLCTDPSIFFHVDEPRWF